MVSPVAKVDIVESAKWLMSVTDEYLIEWGKKKREESIANGAKNPVNANQWLNTKKRYERYSKYKKDIFQEARRINYLPRQNDFWVKFYFPMPKSWSKKKRNILAWSQHLQSPDLDNCLKGLIDGLFPEQDSIVWDYRASKFWSPTSFGFIDIVVGALPEAKGYTEFSLGTDELK